MQWLNKVDDALDWVLGPVQPMEDGDTSATDAEASAVARAARAAAAVAASSGSDGLIADDKPERKSSGILGPSSEPVNALHTINEGGNHQNDGNIIAANNDLAKTKPPVPPPPRVKSAIPPPPPVVLPPPKKAKSSIILPPDTCPSTPIVAMAGEFLVIDESPRLGSSDQTNNTNSNHDDENCEDGSHCRPPDSIFSQESEAMIREGDDEASIQREAEATIQQDLEVTTIRKIPMPLMPQTNQLEELDGGGSSAILPSMVSEQTSPMSRMQKFARASPAPTKVTMGDREMGSSTFQHDNNFDRSNQIRTGDRNDATKMKTIPPPLPLIPASTEEQDMRQPSTEQVFEVPKAITPIQVPPSPSTMIIQLPAQQPSPLGSSTNIPQRQNQHLPNNLSIPPPFALAPNSNNSWESLSTPNPIRPKQPPARVRVATPGVIRRRIREPSLSPPESPATISSPDVVDTANNRATSSDGDGARSKATFIPPPPPPPPPFLPLSVSISTDKDDVIPDQRIPPPPLPANAAKDELNSVSNTLPLVSSTAGIEERENKTTHLDKLHGGVGIKIAKKNAKSGKSKTSIPPIPSPPLNITPITDNRKTSGQPITTQPATFHPLNAVVDRALDLVLGPVEVTDETGDTDFDAEDEMKEDQNDGEPRIKNTHQEILPPMNQVEKALDWVLGPVKVQAPAPGSNTTTGENENSAIQDNEGPVTDAITDWFKRMGSTEEREQKAAKSNADDDSLSDSFHSQVSYDSDFTESDEIEDFALPSPTFSIVQDDPSWDPSLNRYGFFHVRLLRAQRLPCASGSSINATLSLHPWKGRIRIPAHITVDGPEGAGVCLRWDKLSDMKRSGSKGKTRARKEGEFHSMVHAYNSIDTPVPVILLELSISSLGGVFDRFLCSVSVPCHDLLRNPHDWTHKWCPASVKGNQIIDEEGSLCAPLLLLEACFEPKVNRVTVSTLSKQAVLDEGTAIDEQEPDSEEDSDTIGSIPQIIRPERRSRKMPDTVCSSLDDDSISKTSLMAPALSPRNLVTKSHLLRARSFYTPTWCAVCSKNITAGWMQGKNNLSINLLLSGLECEACHIFCCRDCQLQVDACIPCGSELATIAVKKAKQYSVPTLGNVMTTLAPYLETAIGDGTEVNGPVGQSERRSSSNTLHHVDGIGELNIRVLRATIFDKTFPSEAEPSAVFQSDSNLRNGDYYVRVSWLGSKESKRTKTVLQTSKPYFHSEEMVFDVPHYGMEYKLEVLDANSEKPIGSCLLSAQGVLQWQRDAMLSKKATLLQSFLDLHKSSDPRRIKLELRTGVKDGFGLNFYNSSKVVGGPKGKETSRPGVISGWLELDVQLEEDQKLFYSPKPRRCPPRADEEFDIALIQLHIARIGEIIAEIQKLISTFKYVVSWDNPKITGASMIIYIAVILGCNVEYLGALPIGSLVVYMIYLGYLRVNGHFKERWTFKEKKLLIKSENEIEKNQSIARPVGLLQVGDLQGKNLKSRELGLPGSFYTSVLYDPLRYADEEMKSLLVKIDTSSGCIHEVGATVSPGITSAPVWSHMQESPELLRLKHLLPDDRLWRQEKEVDASLAYPILQPIAEDGGFIRKAIDGSQRKTEVKLMPFETSFGAVVFQVRFSDVLGSFQMFDNVLGEVVIPLAKLAGSGKAVEGWFRLVGVGSKDTVPGESNDHSEKSVEMGEDTDVADGKIPAPEFPELYLRVQFSSKGTLFNNSVQSDTETSKVICEELSRTASIVQENNGIGVIGSSLNTINTVRTLGGKLQNQISVVVDILERIRNAFNFSNPRITVFILLSLTLLWIVLALIPTRFVVLVSGLAQYGTNLYIKFRSPQAKKTLRDELSDKRLDSTRKGNPFENLFLSIPTDEDLRRTYFWEARRLGEKERDKFAESKRQIRLEKLWKAKWHGALKLKEKKPEQAISPSSSRKWNWEPLFGLLEGHRFIWWRSEKHFDTGEAPLGQIFFAGHSGLAGLSPLDLMELSNEEIPLVVSIFGRGPRGQQKITLLTHSTDAKDSLEAAVLNVSIKAD